MKRYHILFEPMSESPLPVISIDADGAMRSGGQYIEDEEEATPAVFYRGQPYHAKEYVGRIIDPEKIVAWWKTEVEDEHVESAAFHLLLKPMNGCAVPVISIKAGRAADGFGRFNALTEIPSLFWKDYQRSEVAGRLLRPDDLLAWWKTMPRE